MAAWAQVDEGMDIIVQKTGATGDALEDMQDSARNIAKTIPTDFATAGSAVGEVNTEEVRAKLQADLAYAQGFLASVMKKLSNEKFVSGAPAQVVENERKKQADAEAKIKAIEQQLAELN